VSECGDVSPLTKRSRETALLPSAPYPTTEVELSNRDGERMAVLRGRGVIAGQACVPSIVQFW
jgi:hypothetical protein